MPRRGTAAGPQQGWRACGPVARRTAVAVDAESTLALLSALRGDVRVRLRRGGGGIRVDQVRIGLVTLDRVTFDADLDMDVGPVGLLVFGQVRGGAVGYRTDGAEHWHGDGDVYLAGQPGRCRTAMFRGGLHQQAVIDAALPARFAAAAPGRTEQPVRFTGYGAISVQAAQAWRRTCAYARDTVLDLPDSAASQLVVSSMVGLLVTATLATFPNNALTDPTIEDRHDGHIATLHRAVAFIDDNAHRDITIGDIAAAANVTMRAVQLAFQRHMGTTPMTYLRRVRLEHAHRELLAADPAKQTVTGIAYQWGFPSPSRFATYYRDAYGVLPGHTLRN